MGRHHHAAALRGDSRCHQRPERYAGAQRRARREVEDHHQDHRNHVAGERARHAEVVHLDQELRHPGHEGEVLARPDAEDQRGDTERPALFRAKRRLPGRAPRGGRRESGHTTDAQGPGREDDATRGARPPQQGPSVRCERERSEGGGAQLPDRYPHRGEADHDGKLARRRARVGDDRPAHRKHRKRDSLEPATEQHEPAVGGRGQGQEAADEHERHRRAHWRHRPPAFEEAPRVNREEQARKRVHRHAGAGKNAVVAITLQQHRQRHRQLELLVGGEAGEPDTERDPGPGIDGSHDRVSGLLSLRGLRSECPGDVTYPIRAGRTQGEALKGEPETDEAPVALRPGERASQGWLAPSASAASDCVAKQVADTTSKRLERVRPPTASRSASAVGNR